MMSAPLPDALRARFQKLVEEGLGSVDIRSRATLVSIADTSLNHVQRCL